MKLSHSAILGIASLASILSAGASTVTIYFSASNGDRNATQVALSRLLRNWSYQGTSGRFPASNTLNDNGEYVGTDNAFRGSNFGTWNGTWGGHNVIVKTNYAGALSGIAAVANDQVTVRFDLTTGQGTASVPGNLLTTTDPVFAEHTVDFGLSTNFQNTSPFKGRYNEKDYSEIQEIPVGISQLGFYGSPGIPIDNITTQQAKQLYDAGALPLSFFTGNWNGVDDHKWIFALGRNTDAGQRFGAQLEIGRSGLGEQWAYRSLKPDGTPQEPLEAGGTANAPLIPDPQNPGSYITNNSYDPNKSFAIGSTVIGGKVFKHGKWPNETWSGITATGGHTSGANLASALTRTLDEGAYKAVDSQATAGWYVGYVTPGDADATILGNGQGVQRPNNTKGVALKFNGIENTSANVQSGRYTLWVYNRIIIPKPGEGQPLYSGVVGEETDPSPTFRAEFVEALANGIKQVVSSQQGIALDSNLKVHRLADGGTVYAGALVVD